MFDYEYEMATTLQKKLKCVIKGSIFVGVRDDTLNVIISGPYNKKKPWTYRLDNFSDNMIHGTFDTSRIVADITHQYWKWAEKTLRFELFYQD